MRETLLSFLYDTKKSVLFATRILSLISALTSFVLIIYQLGFPHDEVFYENLRRAIDVLFIFFATTYFIRVVYSLSVWKYIKSTWIEFLFMSIIVITVFNRVFFDNPIVVELFQTLGFARYGRLYSVIISAFLMYLVLLEFVKLSDILNRVAIKPAYTFIYGFLFLITCGCGLLMLPEMTSDAGFHWFEALFTSVSASCVTGLSLVDVSEFYTRKGQVVIMLLMQMGGIGIVSFTTFFATFLSRGVGFRHQVMIQDFLSTESLFNAKGLLRQVVFITLVVEVLAGVCIYFSWGTEVEFTSFIHKLFYSMFHAVSAFCNGGFSLFSNSLYQSNIRASYLLHLVIAVTIIFGSLGFSTIQELFSIKRLRTRMDRPWIDWSVSTKISVYMTLSLIALGLVLFLITERNGVLEDKTHFEQLVIAFFQSVTARTAGFNSIDTGVLTNATLLLLIFLMFIGASPGSTGGGVKTSTFLILSWASWSTVRGLKHTSISKRTIAPGLISKVFTIFIFAAAFNLTMIFVLSITDSTFSVIDLAFEQVSAFTTTGLSTGITAHMTTAGKVILMVSMFIGRIGSLTLLLALSSKAVVTKYTYPKAHVFVG